VINAGRFGTMNSKAKLDSVKVSLKLPYIGGIEGNWKPDKSERNAAWEMYVELITRISVVELKPNEGLMREALSSLYTLFETTRRILRTYGPAVAQPKSDGNISFGYLSVTILNTILRPVLAKWHPLLLDYETEKTSSISQLEHETKWEKAADLRKELNDVRNTLVEYAALLAEVAKVTPLIVNDRKLTYDNI
jgi:hypothetical protein